MKKYDAFIFKDKLYKYTVELGHMGNEFNIKICSKSGIPYEALSLIEDVESFSICKYEELEEGMIFKYKINEWIGYHSGDGSTQYVIYQKNNKFYKFVDSDHDNLDEMSEIIDLKKLSKYISRIAYISLKTSLKKQKENISSNNIEENKPEAAILKLSQMDKSIVNSVMKYI
jgi:hypothetical protein